MVVAFFDWGCSGPGCIYGNVWCGSNFQGIFVIIRENPAGLQGTAAVAESKWTEILMENFYLAEKR